MKPATKAKQAVLASLIAGTTLMSTGCSSGGFSLASMNPFAQAAPSTDPGPGARMTESVASTAGGAVNSAKNAFGKTTSAVAGVFSRSPEPGDESATDPLSLSNKPENIGPEVFVANGQLWESTGDFGKAMESYTKALEKAPNDPPALTSIARLHFRQGNHKLAAEFFRRAIAQSPEDAGLHNDLGLTLSKLGDHAGAAKSLEKALEFAPGTSRYANNLASVKFEAGDSTSAYQVLSKNNKPAVAHFNMAYLHFKNGQMNEASGHLNQAIQSQPQAAGDAAVQRAVDRSRDMLAQIEASMAPVAQAAPQASIAGGQFLGTAKPQVQQTSQSGTPRPNVTPAAMAPAMSAITVPKAASSPAIKVSVPKTTAPSSTAPVAPSTPVWGTSSPKAATTAPTRPMPVKPASEAAGSTSAAPAAETTTANDDDAASFPFALPGGFAAPEKK